MQRAAGVWWVPFGIGVGYGLVGGLVGVVQWVLTQRDLAERWAEFLAHERPYPYFNDATNVSRGNTLFWLVTAPVAAIAMLILCWLAAFMASRRSQRRQDGVMAAWVSAGISSAMYVVATALAVATSVDPGTTRGAYLCEVPFGIVFFSLVLLLAGAGAGMGVRPRKSRGRRAD